MHVYIYCVLLCHKNSGSCMYKFMHVPTGFIGALLSELHCVYL